MSNPGQIASEIVDKLVQPGVWKKFGVVIPNPPPWATLLIRKSHPKQGDSRDLWRAYAIWKEEGLNEAGEVCIITDCEQLLVRGGVFESVLALAIRLMETQIWPSDGPKDGGGSE